MTRIGLQMLGYKPYPEPTRWLEPTVFCIDAKDADECATIIEKVGAGRAVTDKHGTRVVVELEW